MNSGPPVLVWFGRDLRLQDHPALAAAAARGPVLPVFILPGSEHARPLGAAARWWLHHSLAALGAAIAAEGGQLLLLQGDPAAVLADLAGRVQAQACYFTAGHDPDSRRLQGAVQQRLGETLECRAFPGDTLLDPASLLTGDGRPYRVYTPFSRKAMAAVEVHSVLSGKPRVDWAPLPDPGGAPEALALLPRLDWAAEFSDHWVPGEAGAARQLRHFIARGLSEYAGRRDLPAAASTSRLSPHLAHGEIAVARVWQALAEAEAENEFRPEDLLAYRREIIWREFARYLLAHFPELLTENFDRRFDAFSWRDAPELLAAWQRGRTGYPIVDAGMRELWRTGWMHNRVRMVAASFLTKHLRIHWRVGEAWFWDTLVDADAATNAISWQWVAGTGVDAAPYFRVFNPSLQQQKFDPASEYVLRWVPELGQLPLAVAAGGRSYPAPIVDHATARADALAAYSDARSK